MIYMGIFMQKFLKKFRQKPLFMLLPSAAVFLILSVLFLHFHQDADQAFSKYTSELFRQEISGNTMDMMAGKRISLRAPWEEISMQVL